MFRVKQRNTRGHKKWCRNTHGEICEFSNRQKARQYCRNRGGQYFEDMWIVHPDGTEELFQWQ